MKYLGVLTAVVAVGCGGGAAFEGPSGAGTAGAAGSGGGAVGTSGAGGTSSATGGASGASGSSSIGGAAGTTASTGGAAGHDGGHGGSAHGGSAGSGAHGGSKAGAAGSSGASAGMAGAAGSGVAGASGEGGASGTAGEGGSAGAGGSAGTGGSAGGVAGSAGSAATGGGGASSGAGGSAGNMCWTGAVAPDVDPWSIRVPSIPGVPIITNEVSATSSVLSMTSPISLTTAPATISARLDWGGVISYFGEGKTDGNVLDSALGRGISTREIDGSRQWEECEASATCTATPPNTCGANPSSGWVAFQGFDLCGQSPTAVSSALTDRAKITSTAVFYNPAYNLPFCSGPAGCDLEIKPVSAPLTIEVGLRFVDPRVVEIAYELTPTDTEMHTTALQQLIEVFPSTQGIVLPRAVDAAGDTVFTAGASVAESMFMSALPWMAWLSKDGSQGVGLGSDAGITTFIAGGSTTGEASQPVQSFALSNSQKVSIRALHYVALGSFEEIKTSMGLVYSQRPPFGQVENPLPGASMSAGTKMLISGWALDTTPISSIDISIDGVNVKQTSVTTPRPELCGRYVNYPTCPTAGFSAIIDTTSLAPCGHLVRVTATDPDGNTTNLGERLVQIQ